MASFETGSPTLENPTFSFLGTTGSSFISGVTGLSAYGTESSLVVGESGTIEAFGYTTQTPPSFFNYTIVVQIPIPFANLNLNLNLLGDFVLPILTRIGVPKAILWLNTNIIDRLQHVVDDAIKLIQAIPEITITILVKLGPAIVLNIQLIGRKVPVVVPIPTFEFNLPNLAVGVDFSLVIPFPAPPPIIVYVPVPVPIIHLPSVQEIVTISGANVSLGATAGVYPAPFPISNPVYLPTI